MSDFSKKIIPIQLETEMKTSFVSYAMAVIINRALPDVRDGLKPVHRRILYSMHELGLAPDKPFRKCARIVGDVLGKYHPHGDSAVYESLVRMAQPFSMSETLVMGQGNFGSVDGDGAAAMRYTEAKMSKIALEMLKDIDKDTVEFGPNFDGTIMQPLVMPSKYPNLLVNGSGGIAVGMATNIPPHNIGEVIDGVLALIDNKEITCEELMEYIKAPDFPTGGIIMGMHGVRQAYTTGRGKIVVRAKHEIEEMSETRSRIVITEIPYQVNKAKLIEKIAEMVHEKKVEGISDLRDESDRSGMRMVIELKRDVNPDIVLNTLYKHTQLQDTFGVIMLALVDREPKVLNLKQMLYHYLEHQKDVITRRCKFELDKAKERAHILEGLLIAHDNIDEIVSIIKKSSTTKEAKENLMTRFALSDKQSQAILDMRLARLTALEIQKLQEELDEIRKRIEYLLSLLADETLLLGVIRDELNEIKRKFNHPRRTEIGLSYEDIDIESMIQEEDMVVTMTHFGYIKRITTDAYRVQNRGGKGITALSTKEEDFVEEIFVTTTHKNIMFFTNTGRVFRLKCYEIPEAGRQAKGTAIVNLLQLMPGEKITGCFPVNSDEAKYLVLTTKMGIIKKSDISDYDNIRKGGLIAINLRDGDELIGVNLTDGKDELVIGTKHGYSIRFKESDIRAMGRVSIGVRAISLRSGDEVVGVAKVIPDGKLLCVSENGFGKVTSLDEYKVQGRGGKGIKTMNIGEKTGELVAIKLVDDSFDIMLISTDGTMIRIPVDQISQVGRTTIGVTLMKLRGEDKIVCVAKVEKAKDEEEEVTEENPE